MRCYVIKVNGPNLAPFLMKDGLIYHTNSLSDAIDARDNAAKWRPAEYTICLLQELPNI